MPWAVKKAPLWAEVGRNEHGASVVTSKSSFFPKNPERIIWRGYCGDIGLRSPTFDLYFGPGAQSKDGRLPEEETSLLKKTELVNKR